MELTIKLIYITELIGTVAFALSGAMTAIKKELDIFGVIVLGVTTAVGGGFLRDIVLNKGIPIMFQDYKYSALALAVSIVTFIGAYYINERTTYKFKTAYENMLNISDAVGLGVFATTGVNTAIVSGYGDNSFLVIFVGVITGIGGGMLRDIMIGQVPFVLHKRVYALATIAGSWLYYELYKRGYDNTLCVYCGILAVLVIRMLAAHYEWDLPKIRARKQL